ncbi:MAG TPA: hypothetical protein VD931_10790 [Baekduia sp.]|nr:hypothetical protein [Baekduia sp.]
MSRLRLLAPLACIALLALPAAVAAHPGARAAQAAPLNDLFALGQGSGQAVTRVPVVTRPEPPSAPTPQVPCEPGSRPEPGVQGRVPAGAAENGLWCNARLLGRHGASGGFKVLRYRDRAGRECAYYDTALLFPLNVFKASATSLGVVVLDMTDPAHPVQTDRLTELPMLSPHESVTLNQERGLIAAVLGNPATYPGLVSIYDASQDCRHPVLQSTAPVARLGHESGFSPDGRTFYAAATATESITAIDVTDPKAPRPIWQGQVTSHGMSLNDDGTRAYIADPDGQMLVLDTSEIQARKAQPKAREISRLTWDKASIPQNAIPFTRDGKPYVLEIDEYTGGTTGDGDRDAVGAARIIDISDETKPRSIANLRLQVNQPAEHRAASGDPGAFSPVQGYAAHYCGLSSRVDPTVVACSFIASGLRVFDISDLAHPREIAYFVAPTKGRAENGFQVSSFAMSQPEVVPERKEVWYSDGTAGFHALRIADGVWPAAAQRVRRVCGSRRRFAAHVRLPRGARIRSVRATLGGRRVRGARRSGRSVRVPVDLRGRGKGVVVLRVRVTLRGGRTVTTVRRYRVCTSRS